MAAVMVDLRRGVGLGGVACLGYARGCVCVASMRVQSRGISLQGQLLDVGNIVVDSLLIVFDYSLLLFAAAACVVAHYCAYEVLVFLFVQRVHGARLDGRLVSNSLELRLSLLPFFATLARTGSYCRTRAYASEKDGVIMIFNKVLQMINNLVFFSFHFFKFFLKLIEFIFLRSFGLLEHFLSHLIVFVVFESLLLDVLLKILYLLVGVL